MSTAAPPEQDGAPRRGPLGARLLLLVAAAAVLVSLALGWDGGIRDLLTADEVAIARRSGTLGAFETAPSTPFGLLVPYGVALLALAALVITVAVRGVAGRGEAVALAGALACVLSLGLRGILDDAPGVPDGTLMAAGGLLVALPVTLGLPAPARGRDPGWPVLALGLVSAALLTGMVHDAYAAVDVRPGFFPVGARPVAGWPQRWLAAGAGARTVEDLGLVAVATCGLVAAAAAAARRLGRPVAALLMALAGLVALGVLLLALDPVQNANGVDRFPGALGGLVALGLIAALALPAARRRPVVVEEPAAPAAPPRPAPPPPPTRIAPPEAWAHPSKRPHGWWS